MMPAGKKVFDLMGDDIVELSTETDTLKNKIISCDEKWLEESEAKLFKPIDDEERSNLIMSIKEKQMKKQNQVAYISFDKLWRSEIYNNVSAKDKVQEIRLNQLKLKVIVTHEKDE